MKNSNQLEPNREMVFRSSVIALQEAYKRYKSLLNRYMKLTFYNNDGRFSFLSGAEIISKELECAHEDVIRITHEVEHYRQYIDANKKAHKGD